MAEPGPLAPLAGALRDVVAWLDAAGMPGAVIGGVAASLLGRPRATRDVDCVVLVREEGWQAAVESAAPFRIRPRVKDAVAFAKESRVLLLRHEPSGIDVDVSLGAIPFEEEVVKRAVRLDIAGVGVPVATAEDVVIMKAVAGRPRDRADIEGILDANPGLDVARVRRLVREFADVLDAPEKFANLEALLRDR